MQTFKSEFSTLEYILSKKPQPDFNQLLKVLKGEKPDRFTLFEFFLNDELNAKLSGDKAISKNEKYHIIKNKINAFANVGYDYVTINGSDFKFPSKEHRDKKASISINEGMSITDRESFNAYRWPDPDAFDYSRLTELEEDLPDGMKFIVCGPGGVLEIVTHLVGYDNLCYMLFDDPQLIQDIFNKVGSSFVRYYEICAAYDSVGALISNDDWGFNTQTLLSAADLRKYVIPWHKKIVETIHAAKKPAILHSCGQLKGVMDDIIDYIGYDAKHSYEDNIIPVEQAYDIWHNRISILGGIDLDFLCRSTPEEVYKRATAMLEKTKTTGGYGLGSGNSIPDYTPDQNYFALISAVLANR